MSAPVSRGPWRALALLLLAFALVQADAHPPLEALSRFRDERVLPAARRVGAEIVAILGAATASRRVGPGDARSS